MGNGEHGNAMHEIILLPDKERITKATEEKSNQDSSRISVVNTETHALEKDKEHERDDRQTFEEAAENGGWILIRVQDKIQCNCLEKGHQLWSNAFYLEKINKEKF